MQPCECMHSRVHCSLRAAGACRGRGRLASGAGRRATLGSCSGRGAGAAQAAAGRAAPAVGDCAGSRCGAGASWGRRPPWQRAERAAAARRHVQRCGRGRWRRAARRQHVAARPRLAGSRRAHGRGARHQRQPQRERGREPRSELGPGGQAWRARPGDPGQREPEPEPQPERRARPWRRARGRRRRGRGRPIHGGPGGCNGGAPRRARGARGAVAAGARAGGPPAPARPGAPACCCRLWYSLPVPQTALCVVALCGGRSARAAQARPGMSGGPQARLACRSDWALRARLTRLTLLT